MLIENAINDKIYTQPVILFDEEYGVKKDYNPNYLKALENDHGIKVIKIPNYDDYPKIKAITEQIKSKTSNIVIVTNKDGIRGLDFKFGS